MSSNETSRGLRCLFFEQFLNFLALVTVLEGFTGVLCAADAPDVKSVPSSQATVPDPKSEEARKILTKAQETMARFKTFKAEILNTSETSKTKSKTVLYQRNNPDGVMEMRMDSETEIGGIKSENSFITNREGQWELTPTTAIKMEFQQALMMSVQQGMVGINKEELKPGNFSLSETAIDNKSYWVVKEVMANDTSKKTQEILESIPQMKEMLKTASLNSIPLPKVTLYRIGREDDILYSTQQFDAKGNKLNDITYKNVQINLPLAEDAFAIPRNLKIKVAKSLDDYTTMIIDETAGH